MKHNNLAAVVNNGLRTEVYMGRSRSRSRHIYSMPNKSSHPTAYVTYSHLSGLFYQGGIVGTVAGHGTSPIGLLEKFWRILLHLADDAIAKLYVM